jgi:hypothetical protein
MQIITTTMESHMEIPQKARDKTAIWSVILLLGSTQSDERQDTVETHLHQRSLQHYSQ